MGHSILEIEKNGKIYIPKEIQQKYGKKFFIVPYKDKIVLYNMPENPVLDLINIGKKLKDISIDELKKDIETEAYNDIRRH